MRPRRPQMLKAVGAKSLDDFIGKVVPAGIRTKTPLSLPEARAERTALSDLRDIASRNTVFTSMIGMGYYGTVTPKVILRNILENPGWYTAYTPYQAEVTQGRLEALLNYQQMIIDLTGLEIANASLLDEGTAAAEAMAMAKRVAKSQANIFFVDRDTHPQTIGVVETRARAFGWDVTVGDPDKGSRCRERVRRAALLSGIVGRSSRPSQGDRQAARGRRARRHGDRSAGARHADAARRTGRRYRRWLRAALRRADGLWRPARGLLRNEGCLQALDARPRHRRLRR